MRRRMLAGLTLVFCTSIAAHAQTAPADAQRALQLAKTASDHWTAKRPDQAEAAFVEAITLDGRNAAILDRYATFLRYERKSYAAAERLMRRAVELDPMNAAWPRDLSSLLRGMGRSAEADAVYDEMLYRGFTTENVLLYRAVDRRNAGEYVGAERDIRALLTIDSRGQGTRWWLGQILTDQNRFQEAETVLRDVLRDGLDDVGTHSLLGLVLYYLGKFVDAIAEMTEAVRLAAGREDVSYFSRQLDDAKNHRLPVRTPVPPPSRLVDPSPIYRFTVRADAPAPAPTSAPAPAAAPRAAAPPAAASNAPAAQSNFQSGVYVTPDNLYAITVMMTAQGLEVTEPNRKTLYQQQGSDPTRYYATVNGKQYGIRVAERGVIYSFTAAGETRLSLSRAIGATAAAAAPQPAPASNSRVETLNVDGQQVQGIRMLPDQGDPSVAGTYCDPSVPGFCTRLDASGEGTYMPGSNETDRVKWWIEAENGAPKYIARTSMGRQLLLIFQFQEERAVMLRGQRIVQHQAGGFERKLLEISDSQRFMLLAGQFERKY